MLRPANPLAWQQITNDWREEARTEACVRLSGCLHVFRNHLIRRKVARRCRENSVRRYVPEAAIRGVTWAAKVHMKLTLARIERNPHRSRFANA
jgi:hypothetical protein